VHGRYSGCEERVHRRADGGTVAYVVPRLIPADPGAQRSSAVVVAPGEEHRPDLLAFRVLRNPLLAYRLADANRVLDPLTLCDRAGRVVQVPPPDFGAAT
jgi:hypothetical protein